jgi:tRNA A-37 threonylcarbamoyl transferase component Bud32
VSLLGGRFALVREIGSGGMSTVFLGRDEVLDRPVAIKILNPDLEDSGVSARFRREGRTAAKLSHPNIVQVYDAGEDELEGREVSYIVVEYVPGGDLKDLIDTRGPLPGIMLSRIGADVADGLAHAHERGVIHRDIKPQNIIIDDYGSPKLTDFGIARALHVDHSTSTGSYLGTALYSSPEQLWGEGVTPKSDIYSLGTSLYHAAVGEPPFSGDPLQVATQQVAKLPTPPRARGAAVGERLEDLILRCLAKDPAERPDALTLHGRLLQISAAATTGAGTAGVSGVTRDTGAAKAAGAAGVKAVKRSLSRRGTPDLPGPPEITISLPTRTFRPGTRQRMTLAAFLFALFLLALAAVGSWTLLGSDTRQEAPRLFERVVQPRQNIPEAPAAPSGGNAVAANTTAGEAVGEPVLPEAQAEKAVFDMYVQESYQTPGTSWAFLSERLQNEVASPEQWAEREQIYDLYYAYFTQLPEATVSGDTAEVTFEVRLDRSGGQELLSGTWVCIVEDGEWKLDRLKNERIQPL